MTKKDRAALDELVQSSGWALFVRLAREHLDPAEAMRQLSTAFGASESVEKFGQIAAGYVVAQRTTEMLLQLPYSYLEMGDQVDESEVDG